METLYVDRKGSELDIQAGRLQVRLSGTDKPFSVPLKILEFLVVSAPVQFSSTLLSRLTLAGVTVVFLNLRKEEASSISYGLLHNAVDRRLMQYQAISNSSLVLCYSKELVKQKLRSQKAMLIQALRQRRDQRLPLFKAIKHLTDLESRLEYVDSLDSLRGIEGVGAAMYFKAYQCIFPPPALSLMAVTGVRLETLLMSHYHLAIRYCMLRLFVHLSLLDLILS